jgi:hypothetical protein
LINANLTQFLVPVLLTQLAVAVVGLDGDNLAKEYGAKIQKHKNSNSMSAFGSGQTEEFDELNPNGRYSEFWPMRWPNKPNQPKSNHKTANHKSKPHFPIPAHSYFAPIIYNLASAFKPYVPLYVPKKTPSYDRPTSVSPDSSFFSLPPKFTAICAVSENQSNESRIGQKILSLKIVARNF